MCDYVEGIDCNLVSKSIVHCVPLCEVLFEGRQNVHQEDYCKNSPIKIMQTGLSLTW